MHRQVRSFVRRTGRMTPAQQGALTRLWPRYGIDYAERLLDLDACFGRTAPRTLEIGFGNGDTLVEQAVSSPDRDFLGIEVHEPGIGHCLLQLDAADIGNVKLMRHDALEVLAQQIPDAALDRVNLYFPDPWPKKRHHKRRIVQDAFLQLVAHKLCSGGRLCIATDWANYAGHIDAVIARAPQFGDVEVRDHAGDRPLDRPTTRFERRGMQKGHRIRDWQLRRR